MTSVFKSFTLAAIQGTNCVAMVVGVEVEKEWKRRVGTVCHGSDERRGWRERPGVERWWKGVGFWLSFESSA